MCQVAAHASNRRRLAALTVAEITALARAACGDDRLEVRSWHFQPVQGGFGSAVGGTALHRVEVQTTARKTASLILKTLHARAGEAPNSPYYWKREYEVYRSKLLDDLPADSFSTPRIYATQDFGDACWIWMEDIADRKADWSLDDFHDIARRLGRFNGAGLKDPPSSFGWLPVNWHSAIAPGLADAFAKLDQLLESPLARIALPLASKDEIIATWQDRHIFQEALARLPRTLCHTDAFPRNILHRASEPALLDWALASISGLGEELVCLVAVSLYYDGFSAEYADQLDKTVFAGYIAGLREAGWRGDPKLARIGYTCGMVLRGLAGVKQDLLLLRDPASHDQLKLTHQMTSLEDIARLFAEVRRFRLLKMAREARRLLSV